MEQVTAKMRKDLVLAHQLAEENRDLEYYKGVLQKFQEELLEKQKAAEAKATAAATPKSSKKKGKAVSDDDVEMEDADDDEVGTKKDKKRKNTDDSETPQRSESVKKPKIKLTHNSTPKSNGASSKAGKAGGDVKASSKKAKKPKEDSEERVQTPKEPEISAEEKYERKKKEVLFLRHKLQKGLLTRDQQPKEEEMKMMSDYLTKLEGFPDLETEIIRITKINKVLKAMLKLDHIPKEEEFTFKPRSQVLLEKWNRLLASDDTPNSPNGVNGHKVEKTPVKEESKPESNGVKTTDTEQDEAPKAEAKEVAEESKDAVKEEASSNEQAVAKEELSSNEEKPNVDEVRYDLDCTIARVYLCNRDNGQANSTELTRRDRTPRWPTQLMPQPRLGRPGHI